MIIFSPITQILPQYTVLTPTIVIQIKNVYNPKYSGTSGEFYFESLLPGEFSVIESYKIAGIEIASG